MCNWTLFRHFSIVDQKPFLRVWQKSKWQKMSICKCENVLPFDLENFLTFGWGKFNRNCFMDWQVCKLHVCQLFLIEFALSKWQKDKDKKATLIWIRKRGFFLQKHCHQLLLHLKFRGKKCIDSTTKTNCTFWFTTIKVSQWNSENIACISIF